MTKGERRLKVERRQMRMALVHRQFQLHDAHCHGCQFLVKTGLYLGRDEETDRHLYAKESICDICLVGQEIRRIGDQLERT